MPKLLAAAIAFPSVGAMSWPVPENVKKYFAAARIVQLFKDPEEFREYATDVEALGHLSAASLDQPLSEEGTLIMQTLMWRNKERFGDIPEELKPYRELNDQEKARLRDLKRWIRRRQWQAFRD